MRVRDAELYLLAGLPSGLLSMLLSLFLPLFVPLHMPLLAPAPAARIRAAGDRWAAMHWRRASDHLACDRAGRAAGDPRMQFGPRQVLRWLIVSAPVSVVCGLVALAVAVAVPAAVLVALLWWAAPQNDPLTLSRIAITDWPTAIWVSALHVAVAVLVAVLVLPAFARWHARLTLALLAPSATEVLGARVETLAQTRAGALDTHQAELRRIERDLHDGTQARLVAINLRLGMARRVLSTDLTTAANLLDQARDGTEAAMHELRGMIRTVYPPVLADRGLPGALQSLAAQATPPARLVAGEVGKLPAAVEVAAYYAVSEALTNVARHSAATTVTIAVERLAGTLRVSVTDNGIGGADETRGSGIQGIRRRVAALDGVARVDSPAGGPTTIIVELPCE